MRSNQLVGYGIVVGLSGTGDGNTQLTLSYPVNDDSVWSVDSWHQGANRRCGNGRGDTTFEAWTLMDICGFLRKRNHPVWDFAYDLCSALTGGYIPTKRFIEVA